MISDTVHNNLLITDLPILLMSSVFNVFLSFSMQTKSQSFLKVILHLYYSSVVVVVDVAVRSTPQWFGVDRGDTGDAALH